MLRKSFREGIGVRSQESGGDLKISLPSLEIPKNAHFFRYTLQNSKYCCTEAIARSCASKIHKATST
ncbi:MAG: hypothetical protein ACKPE3_38795, partial [Sphaerospermopsis kisseleviana]